MPANEPMPDGTTPARGDDRGGDAGGDEREQPVSSGLRPEVVRIALARLLRGPCGSDELANAMIDWHGQTRRQRRRHGQILYIA